MIRATCVAALMLLPQTATALSCLQPDLARDYQQIASSDQSYSILVGRVVHDVAYHSSSDSFRFDAQFIGYGLAPDGMQIPLNQTIMVEGQCITGACGSLRGPDVEQILFARHETGSMVIELAPCAATPTPATPENLAIIETCLSGGACDLLVRR